MSRDEIIGKILDLTKKQGGHIGFKEVDMSTYLITDISIYSDGTMKYSILGVECREYIDDRGRRFLDKILELISENKFL